MSNRKQYNDLELFEAFKANSDTFCEDYRQFLNISKTERECVVNSVILAEEAGFQKFDFNSSLKSGDKVYFINRAKAVFLAIIGSEPIVDGVNIVVSHVDSPRIDLKPHALYELKKVAFFKTRYYGGIKKYQWTTVPLSLHGVVIKKDGTKVKVSIGSNPCDPVFTITDLLPHLAREQMKKSMHEGILGEKLNPIVGSLSEYISSPVLKNDREAKSESETVKKWILKLLEENYGITEEDLITSELELVPSWEAREVGLDRSMIGGYGQDDRVCAYTSLKSILSMTDIPKKTALCALVDKEEIGSMGNTGMMSRAFEDFLAYLIQSVNGKCSNVDVRRLLSNSACLSADVEAALDPLYADVSEETNAARLNGGVAISKYTGSSGKSSTSDSNAEFLFQICQLFNKNNIVWQIGELGSADAGGGGTVAQFIANLNVDVIDCGVPILSMHSPFELAAKLDIYSAYLAYRAFLQH